MTRHQMIYDLSPGRPWKHFPKKFIVLQKNPRFLVRRSLRKILKSVILEKNFFKIHDFFTEGLLFFSLCQEELIIFLTKPLILYQNVFKKILKKSTIIHLERLPADPWANSLFSKSTIIYDKLKDPKKGFKNSRYFIKRFLKVCS